MCVLKQVELDLLYHLSQDELQGGYGVSATGLTAQYSVIVNSVLIRALSLNLIPIPFC